MSGRWARPGTPSFSASLRAEARRRSGRSVTGARSGVPSELGGDPGSDSHRLDPYRHLYGDAAAPVTVVEYGDFQCPFCRDATPVLKELVDSSGGGIRLVFRHFPLFTVHPFALTAALAAEAAGERFWQLHAVPGPTLTRGSCWARCR